MNTLYLTAGWDLTVDINGNIAMASDPYSIAQDAASAIKTFLGECYYDTTQGIDYFGQILGQAPNMPYLKAQWIAAAETVPEVTSAQVFITGINSRAVNGQVQITSSAGNFAAINFGTPLAQLATTGV